MCGPHGDGSPNNKLSGLGVDGFGLTPSFSRDTHEYNLIVDSSVGSLMVNATAADSSARVTGAGSISLQNASTDVIITVTAQNGNVRTYTIHVVKQDGGPTSGSTGSPVTPGGGSGSAVRKPRRPRQLRRTGRFRRTRRFRSGRQRQHSGRKQCNDCTGAVLIRNT